MATNPKVLISIQFPCHLGAVPYQVAPVMTCDPGGTSRALETSDPNLPTTKPLGETCDPPSAAGRDVETTRNGRSIRSLGAPVATFFCFFPFNLTPLKRKIQLPNRKRYFYFPMFSRLMMISRCWSVLSSMLIR